MHCIICGGGTPGGNRHSIANETGHIIYRDAVCDDCAARPLPKELHGPASWTDAWRFMRRGWPVCSISPWQRRVLIVPVLGVTIADTVLALALIGGAVVGLLWQMARPATIDATRRVRVEDNG